MTHIGRCACVLLCLFGAAFGSHDARITVNGQVVKGPTKEDSQYEMTKKINCKLRRLCKKVSGIEKMVRRFIYVFLYIN